MAARIRSARLSEGCVYPTGKTALGWLKVFRAPLEIRFHFFSSILAARAACRTPDWVRRGRRAGVRSAPVFRSFVPILLFGGLGYEDHF